MVRDQVIMQCHDIVPSCLFMFTFLHLRINISFRRNISYMSNYTKCFFFYWCYWVLRDQPTNANWDKLCSPNVLFHLLPWQQVAEWKFVAAVMQVCSAEWHPDFSQPLKCTGWQPRPSLPEQLDGADGICTEAIRSAAACSNTNKNDSTIF